MPVATCWLMFRVKLCMKSWIHVSKTIPSAPFPGHRHFYRWYTPFPAGWFVIVWCLLIQSHPISSPDDRSCNILQPDNWSLWMVYHVCLTRCLGFMNGENRWNWNGKKNTLVLPCLTSSAGPASIGAFREHDPRRVASCCQVASAELSGAARCYPELDVCCL